MVKAIILTTTMLVLLGTGLAAAHNVSGTITCDGLPVAGVAVSDGDEVVLTDADGCYAMTSTKLNNLKNDLVCLIPVSSCINIPTVIYINPPSAQAIPTEAEKSPPKTSKTSQAELLLQSSAQKPP